MNYVWLNKYPPGNIPLPRTDCLTIVCDSTPEDLTRFVTWLKNNPNEKQIRKIIIPYGSGPRQQTYGEYVMAAHPSPIVAKVKHMARYGIQLQVSPVLDRTNEELEDYDSLVWPCVEDYTTNNIIANAYASQRYWTHYRVSGKTGLQELIEELTPRRVKELIDMVTFRTCLDRDETVEFLKTCYPWEDESVDTIPKLRFNLPLFGMVRSMTDLKKHLVEVIDGELNPHNFLRPGEKITFMENYRVKSVTNPYLYTRKWLTETAFRQLPDIYQREEDENTSEEEEEIRQIIAILYTEANHVIEMEDKITYFKNKYPLSKLDWTKIKKIPFDEVRPSCLFYNSDQITKSVEKTNQELKEWILKQDGFIQVLESNG